MGGINQLWRFLLRTKGHVKVKGLSLGLGLPSDEGFGESAVLWECSPCKSGDVIHWPSPSGCFSVRPDFLPLSTGEGGIVTGSAPLETILSEFLA